MAKSVFSDGYRIVSASDEKRFNEALSRGDVEETISILEKLPHGITNNDKIWRARVLIEGYRSIFGLERGIGELKERASRLNDYIEINGSLELSEGILDAVSDHMLKTPIYGVNQGGWVRSSGYEDLEDKEKICLLKEQLEELREYMEIGTVDDFVNYKKNSEEECDISPLETI